MVRYTDEELAELGIERTEEHSQWHSRTKYTYKCATCGRPASRYSLILERPIYCNICTTDAMKKRKKAKLRAEQEAKYLEKLAGIDPNLEDRFYKASAIVRRCGDFEEAISKAKKYTSKYDSIPEAVTAIVLSHLDIKYIPQAKIKDMTVDFALVDLKTVIEVDGAIYHTNKEKEFFRDCGLRNILGNDWNVIHLPAESVAKRPKVLLSLLKKKLLP